METLFREIAFGSEEYRAARELRNEVLRKPLGMTLSDEDIEQERGFFHAGLFAPDGRLAACIVVIPLSKAAAKVRQVAVLPEFQRKGLGRKLMVETEARLAAAGFRRLELSSRATAIGFYEKLGYTAVGEAFIAVTIPHRKMRKDLANDPE